MKNLIRSGLMVLLSVSTLIAKTQVPLLSSYPSATAVIFLDFDGQTVDNTSWNTSGPIYCGASGLTNSQITEIFNRVSEDYRPFNINITTDSTIFFAAPANHENKSDPYRHFIAGMDLQAVLLLLVHLPGAIIRLVLFSLHF